MKQYYRPSYKNVLALSKAKQVTVSMILKELRKDFPSIQKRTVQNIVVNDKEFLKASHWEKVDNGSNRRHRVYNVIKRPAFKELPTSVIGVDEIGERIVNYITRIAQENEKLHDQLESFNDMIEENRILKQKNTQLIEEILELKKTRAVPKTAVGLQ